MDGVKRFGLLFFLLIILGLFFYFSLYRYFSFDILKQHRGLLIDFTKTHLITALGLFALIYMLVVAASLPVAWFLTIVSGFLFGTHLGVFIVLLSATMGALIVYLAVRFALRDWVLRKTVTWLKLMEKGFQTDAFSYLLFLRLVPLFPFWLVNIVPALLGIPIRIFLLATFLGIIPGSFIYVWVGSGLGHVFDANEAPSLLMLQDKALSLPLMALGLLALLPVIYRRFMKRRTSQHRKS